MPDKAKPGRGILRTPYWLARHPRVGLILFIVGVIIFGLIAYDVVINGPITRLDTTVLNDLHQSSLTAPRALVYFIISGWYLGKEMVILTAVLMGLYYIYKRFWPEFWMVLLGKGGGVLVFMGLSYIFHRPRPTLTNPLVGTLTIPGFPSGHAISAITSYGLIAYLLMPMVRTRAARRVIVIIAVLIILFIGFSRTYVGGHYLSDVLAGYAVGTAWAGLTYTLVERYFLRRAGRGSKVENE